MPGNIVSSIAWLVAGIVAYVVAMHLRNHGDRLDAAADAAQNDLDRFKADVAVSYNCCKALVHHLGPEARCECFACRSDRHESVTAESQALAARIQEQACEAWERATLMKREDQ